MCCIVIMCGTQLTQPARYTPNTTLLRYVHIILFCTNVLVLCTNKLINILMLRMLTAVKIYVNYLLFICI